MGTGTVIKARDVNYAVSTGAGATIAISGITLATEAVVTTSAPHGITDATVVLFAGILGMTELNGLTLPVDVLTATTFKIVKYNTLNSASYISGGTIAPLTFTNACELNNYQWTSGSTPETDDSTWCDDVAKIGFGKPDPGSTSFNYQWSDSAVVQALEKSRDDVSLIVFRVGFKNYTFKRFYIGTVTQVSSGVADGVNGKYEGTAQLRNRFNPINVTPTP